MAYKKIGVYGATGRLGQEITRALVDEGFEVVPFSRKNTVVAGIPTQSADSLVGFDAIVATVGHEGMMEQEALIERAKRDGVKRFVPSEFGVDHRLNKIPFFEPKRQIAKKVQDANFPDGWTAIASGFFEMLIPLFVKVDPEASTITIPGKGEREYPYTVRYDIGRVLAATFREPAKYKDTWLMLANDWLSLNEVAQAVRDRRGPGFKIQHTELSTQTPVLLALDNNPQEMIFDRREQMKPPFDLSDLSKIIEAL